MLSLELGIVAILIVINGLLAMSELAIVSSRPARLMGLVEKGVSGSRPALALASDPGKFLSTVQIGITLVGIFAGAFGGATLAAHLSHSLSRVSFLAPYSDKVAFGLVVAVITYFSLVLGELVPKRFGLSNPEGIAMRVARS